MTKRKPKLVGGFYYASQGRRPITVYVAEKTYEALEAQAKAEERSLQTFVRRILEQQTKTE